MNSICLPIPLVLLLRRLFNAFSAFSISQNYLTSRWRASLETQDVNDETEKDASLNLEGAKRSISARVSSSWDLLKSLNRAFRYVLSFF